MQEKINKEINKEKKIEIVKKENNIIAKAILSNGNSSPRKMGLVAALIRKKNIMDAKIILKFSDKKASDILLKLLNSAIANAKKKNKDIKFSNIVISDLFVGAGIVMKRMMPRAKGRGCMIKRRKVNVKLFLGEIDNGK